MRERANAIGARLEIDSEPSWARSSSAAWSPVTTMTRLLLADDHRMLRDSLRRSMEEHGFDVVGEAGDGAEAVRLAQDLRPDVVLMDVSMPVLDGVEATRQITRLVPRPRS